MTLVLIALAAMAQTPSKVDFLKEVHPVLTTKCMPCHSGDAAQVGLRTTTREDLLRGGKSGPAIVPGKGSQSLLIQRMEGKAGLRMPPSGAPINPDVIERIRTWIDQGAQFDAPVATSERIAPLAPRKPAIPPGDAENPIDRFVGAPSEVVSDALFARRVWLDITGLPPTPEELREFENSKQANKRKHIIDRLLDDRTAYAENWISFWNDLLRNDEGVNYFGERKSITTWLESALEKNLPYDKMVEALLNPQPKKGPEGFLVGMTWRGEVSPSQSPPMQAAQNAAQVFLGINLKCAACHDSFINRWKLKDTYGLASMFSEQPLELVRRDLPLGSTAEAKFPFPELKVDFSNALDSRRKAAAEWFVHPENGRFTRTIVNRYWKHLFGRGIVEPADDMDAMPWNQDLLDWLAVDFAEHDYDLQHVLRQIMTSRAYQMASFREHDESKEYVFRGPQLRRLSAEQFADTISAVTGDWRVRSSRTQTYGTYTREWRLKSDPLSRALGRPIRDQVYTERSTSATTLQALELTNGPLLSKRLERGAKALLGDLEAAPANLFDSKLMRSGSVAVDVDISGAKELWLIIDDVDSYDRSRVIAGWADAELIGPQGVTKLDKLPATTPVRVEPLKSKTGDLPAIVGGVPASMSWNIEGKGFTRFRAQAMVDERSRPSDIGPAIRFFIFTEKPNPERLIRIEGEAPYEPEVKDRTPDGLARRLYAHLLSREPTAGELKIARNVLGAKPSVARVEDFLWAMLMSPEFQYIH